MELIVSDQGYFNAQSKGGFKGLHLPLHPADGMSLPFMMLNQHLLPSDLQRQKEDSGL